MAYAARSFPPAIRHNNAGRSVALLCARICAASPQRSAAPNDRCGAVPSSLLEVLSESQLGGRPKPTPEV